MKSKLVYLLVIASSVAAVAVQDGLKFDRTYKVGEADKFKLTMAMETGMGSIDVAIDLTQSVKKVHENGDADIETAIGSMKINAMGNEMSPPAPPATTQRYDKRGVPVATGAPAAGGQGQGRGGMAGGMSMMMNFSRFGGVMTDKALKVGETVKIVDEKGQTSGTVKLESVEDGLALLVTNLEVKGPDGGAPMKVSAKTWIEVANSKMKKMEGTITDLPGQQQMPIDSVKVSMVRG